MVTRFDDLSSHRVRVEAERAKANEVLAIALHERRSIDAAVHGHGPGHGHATAQLSAAQLGGGAALGGSTALGGAALPLLSPLSLSPSDLVSAEARIAAAAATMASASAGSFGLSMGGLGGIAPSPSLSVGGGSAATPSPPLAGPGGRGQGPGVPADSLAAGAPAVDLGHLGFDHGLDLGLAAISPAAVPRMSAAASSTPEHRPPSELLASSPPVGTSPPLATSPRGSAAFAVRRLASSLTDPTLTDPTLTDPNAMPSGGVTADGSTLSAYLEAQMRTQPPAALATHLREPARGMGGEATPVSVPMPAPVPTSNGSGG